MTQQTVNDMANLLTVNLSPMSPQFTLENKIISWVPNSKSEVINTPQIYFDSGEPWQAANSFAFERLGGISGSNIKTVTSIMGHLKAYATWLEENMVDWRQFPEKKKDRCLYKFRGFLISQRDNELLAASTATSRMSAVINFYRWAKINGWIERKSLWDDNYTHHTFYTSEGLQRTLGVLSSELAIPNRKSNSLKLEDGLLPISNENQIILLNFLHGQKNIELYLMCLIGLFTGARSETIRTLRLSSLANAYDDPEVPDIKKVNVGPGTNVKTKFDVRGTLSVPKGVMELLEQYSTSVRRLLRTAKANPDSKNLLFITQQGNAYSETTFTKLISKLRESLLKHELNQFKTFKFHQTRASFGTRLMRTALESLPSQVSAIIFVRDAMLHKHESTTWKYINFLNETTVKEAYNNEFFELFTGSIENAKKLINEVTYDV